MLQDHAQAPGASRLVPGRRAASRLRLSIPAQFASIFGTHDCILLDLSQTGARIGLTEPLERGAQGFLRVGALEMFGETVHATRYPAGGFNGLVFDDPLSFEDVLAMRHHAETLEDARRAALRDQVRQWVMGER